ncbi:MAG: hypothetical protein ACRDUY_05255 [Nitriliruptorales bacterium]
MLSDLYFANGIALSPDGSYLVVAETARYQRRTRARSSSASTPTGTSSRTSRARASRSGS